MRIPFIDSQTRVAQSNSLLWYMEYQRARGARLGQLVSYPVKKWYKNRRRFLDTDSNVQPNRLNTPTGEHTVNENSNSMDAFNIQQALAKQSSNNNNSNNNAGSEEHDHHASGNHKTNNGAANASTVNIDDWHMHEDSFDTFDVNDDDSDGDDYEDSRKKKGKKVSCLLGLVLGPMMLTSRHVTLTSSALLISRPSSRPKSPSLHPLPPPRPLQLPITMTTSHSPANVSNRLDALPRRPKCRFLIPSCHKVAV